MVRNWMKASVVPVLVATLWAAGCTDHLAPSEHLLGPDAVSFSKESSDKKPKKEKKVKTRKKGAKQVDGEVTLVMGVLPANLEGKTEKAEIGPKGGEIELAGHRLVVPEGAVSGKTQFTMKLFTRTIDPGERGGADNQTYVGVELRARTYDCDGDGIGERAEPKRGCAEIDRGGKGFDVPVVLYLSYATARSFDPNSVDAKGLRVIWLAKPDIAELQNTVPAGGQRVRAELDHFSDYLLAMP